MRKVLYLLLLLITLNMPEPAHGQARVGDGGADPTVEEQTAIYTGITVLDGTGAAPTPDMTIVVQDGRIAEIGSSASIDPHAFEDAKLVDASGLYVIPGLIESHTHLATVANRKRAEFLLNRYIYAGITTARDMAGDVRSLAELQRAALVGEIDAPDIHYSSLVAGPTFWTDPRTVSSSRGEAPGLVPWMQTVENETNLIEAVAMARGTWATGLKTYAAIEGPLLASIAGEAHRQGMPVWSHTHVGPARPMEVAQAGVTSMSHVCSLAAAAISDEVFAQGQAGERSGFVDVDLESPRIVAVLEEMSNRGIILDATVWLMVRMQNRPRQGPPPGAAREGQRPQPPPDVRRRGVRGRCNGDGAVALTRRAHEAGVRIAAGTDGMTSPDSTWPALFNEIALLHERVGMPMAQALKAASLHGAIALGLDDQLGTVEVGKYANLVFLQEDPMAGPESLKSVVFTLKRGRQYDRADFVLGSPE